MHSLFRRFQSPILLIFFLFFATNAHAQKDSSPHSNITLVSENTSIQPGVPFWVATRLKMEPHWHSYWVNPGDAGLPTSLSWELPAGFKAGPIVWPHPTKIPLPPLMSYGYENEVWLLTQITPPKSLTQKSVTLRAKAKWLVCKEACLPASANISISLPVKSETPQSDTRWTSGFAKTRAEVPTTDSTWKVRAERAVNKKDFVLHLQVPKGANIADWNADELYFFSSQSSVIEPAAPQKFQKRGDEFVVTLAISEYSEDIPKNLTGILLAPKNGAWNNAGNRSLAVDAPIEKAGSIATASATPTAATTSGGSGTPTLPIALALALGGGLLLNLMPCVFPVLSLKILGFVQQAGEDKSRIKKHGFAFGAGVMLSFWALAGVLLIVRATGVGAGWGYQLQYPPFVAALVILLFIVGLNLLGAFEIGVSLTRLGSAQAGEYSRQRARLRRFILERRSGNSRRHALHRAVHGFGAGVRLNAIGGDSAFGFHISGIGHGRAVCDFVAQSGVDQKTAQARRVDGNFQTADGVSDFRHRVVASHRFRIANRR